MLKRKSEFRPDKIASGPLSKLYITKKQRRAALKWLLLAAVLVLLGVIQDVILTRFRVFGTTFDILAAALLLACILQDPEIGSVFILLSSLLYWFSGSAPGPYVIVLLTGLGIFFAVLRHCYLHDQFGSVLFCTGAALLLYEAAVFLIGVFLGHTTIVHWSDYLIKAAISLAVMPAVYPVLVSIGKFGGMSWSD